MIRENTRTILKHISGERAFDTVAEISTYHRIQASTGYRAAAEHLKKKLDRMGLGGKVLSFDAKEGGFWGPYPSFAEWDIKGAFCDLVYPHEERLADFDACAISVMQKSAPADLRDKEVPVVFLDKGPEEKAYKGLDLEGKIVFYQGDINDIYEWAVEKRGAIGLLTDFVLQDPLVRERHDQSDTRRYTSFWWKPGQKKAFGFVLTPRQGDKFAALCRELAAKKDCPKVSCMVDSSIYDGHIEDVEAFLPGETDEEILLTGLLCHPSSSANDNASGSASVIEAMKTIKDLIDCGKLPPLKRGIRMLLVPEFSGTYAYIDKYPKKAKKIKAAFNLDMVGARQDRGYGPITITDLPLAMPSFVGDAAAVILDEIKHQVTGMNPEFYCPMFNSHQTPFTGGSDHLVWSDPSMGVPCLMLGQWPDKYYHTSTDTLDKVDPYILSRSAALAASYAYCLANLEQDDVLPIIETGLARAADWVKELKTLAAAGKVPAGLFSGRVEAYTKFRLGAIDSFRSWDVCEKGSEAEKVFFERLDDEKLRLRSLIKLMAGFDPVVRPAKSPVARAQKEKYSLVIRRTVPTPFQILKPRAVYDAPIQERIDAFGEKFGKSLGYGFMTPIGYYFDGKRTTAEAAKELAYETGKYAPAAVDEYARILVMLGYAEVVSE
ncbi:MAG: DUF4910 domain-containing protein [Firmicutes bacterium]|nr:DUF4910 domain-containing protein [Bacillota bacterium]